MSFRCSQWWSKLNIFHSVRTHIGRALCYPEPESSHIQVKSDLVERACIMELGNLGLTWSCPLASANFLTAVNVVSTPVQWGCRWLPPWIARVLKPSYALSVVLGTRDLSKFGFLFITNDSLLRLYPGYFINMYTFYTHKRKPLLIKDAVKFWRER